MRFHKKNYLPQYMGEYVVDFIGEAVCELGPGVIFEMKLINKYTVLRTVPDVLIVM